MAKITCKISNASSRRVTPKVKLQQKESFYTLSRDNQRVVAKNLVSLIGEPIGAHTSDIQYEFLLTIPSSAAHTISNCSILQLDYVVEVCAVERCSDGAQLHPLACLESFDFFLNTHCNLNFDPDTY